MPFTTLAIPLFVILFELLRLFLLGRRRLAVFRLTFRLFLPFFLETLRFFVLRLVVRFFLRLVVFAEAFRRFFFLLFHAAAAFFTLPSFLTRLR